MSFRMWNPRRRRPAAFLLLAGAVAACAWLLPWDDRAALVPLRNTVWLAAGTCAVSLPVGTLLALLLVRTDMPGRRGVLVLLAVMLLMPLYLQASAWHAGFGPLGWFSIARQTIGSPVLQGMRAAVWVHALASVPWVVLFVGAALRYVEPELEEEALLAGPVWRVFFQVTLRRAVAAMGVAALWVLLATAGEMTVTDLYRVRTSAEAIYTGFALGDGLGDAWRRALPGMVICALLVASICAVVSAAAPALHASSRPPWRFRLGRWRWPALAAVLAIAMLIAAAPVGNLIYQAGVAVALVDGQPVRHWSAIQFGKTVLPVLWDYADEFRWTLVIGSLAATIAIAVALPLAWLARGGRIRAIPAVLVSAVCLATPGPLAGLGVIWLLDRPHPLLIWLYDRTVFAPVLALLIRVLPIAVLLCWLALRSLPQVVLDSAACDGAGPWSKLWLVAAPQRLAAIAAAWLAAFLIGAGDLACSILVVPPGVTTLPIRVFGLIHYGVDQQVAAVCLTALGASAAIAAAVWALLRWSQS